MVLKKIKKKVLEMSKSREHSLILFVIAGVGFLFAGAIKSIDFYEGIYAVLCSILIMMGALWYELRAISSEVEK